MKNCLPYLILFLFCSSCISRMQSPGLIASVLDYDGKPIANCLINSKILTDKNGKFHLPEVRYNAFFLTEMFHMEAPPSFFHLKIEKKGYIYRELSQSSSFGGSNRKGTVINLDTIYLRKTNEELSLDKIIHQKWLFAINPTNDTLFFIQADQKLLQLDRHKIELYNKYQTYSYPYYYDRKSKMDSLIRKEYTMQSNRKGSFTGLRVTRYTESYKSNQKLDDTVKVKGEFKVAGQKINFNSNLAELNTNYKADTLDRDFIIFVKEKNKA